MNIERYKWPVIIAASLHGALFLSIPDTTARDMNPPDKGPDLRPMPRVDPIEVPLEPADDPVIGVAGGGKPLPHSPDVPVPLTDREPFTVPVTQDLPRLDPIKDLKDYRGEPVGPGDGPGNFRAVGMPDVTHLDRVPRAMVQPSPDYPMALRNDGVGGTVTVAFVVDTTGRVMSAEAVKWTHREFVEPAVRAVLRWRFEPGTLGGKKVRFRMAVPIEFNAER